MSFELSLKTVTNHFFITTPNGLVRPLVEELQEMGVSAQASGEAAAKCEGGLEEAYKVCLWSRLGNRVLWPLLKEGIRGPEDLYKMVNDFPWEEHMDVHTTIAIDASGKAKGLDHTHFAALKVKDALCDRFREKTGERPSVDPENPGIRLNLRLNRGRAEISLDFSGGSLHRRGYRTEAGEAPLKENLAAGLLRLSGWGEMCNEGCNFFDPMCGSGTLVIEAAMMAMDVAPGLVRERFGFKAWKNHDSSLWANAYREAQERRKVGIEKIVPGSIVGRDSDERVLRRAVSNAKRAGVHDAIRLQRGDISVEVASMGVQGLLLVNPPYGERLGTFSQLRSVYTELGNRIRELQGWQACVFSSEPELCAYFGRAPDSSETLFNGAIETRLFHYGNEEANDELVKPVLNRLRKNLKHLSKWSKRTGVECYRLYDADLPEFSFAVDVYRSEGEFYVHLQEYDAPKEIEVELAERRRLAMTAAVSELLEIPIDQVVLKTRTRQKGREQYKRGQEEGDYLEIIEGEAALWVNLEAYLDTGLFLDHRPLRLKIAKEAKGKSFLNLFCYTASVSVHAALGGASETVSVDLSSTYLNWAASNYALNDLDAESNDLIRADCREWLQESVYRRLKFDIILLDPPTFSNSKRMDGVLDVQKDHVELIKNAARLLNPGGVLYFSNNFRKFRLDEEALSALDVQDISKATLDEDFRRNSKIHRCWKIKNPS